MEVNRTSQDLSTLLQAGNLFIGALVLVLYFHFGPNVYVDIYTVLLACVFGAENILLLAYEKRHRDPFLVILVFVATFFYLTRVSSLLYDPWSQALSRYPFVAADLNRAFLFIAASNLAIFLGLLAAKGRGNAKEDNSSGYLPGRPLVVAGIFALILFVNYFPFPVGGAPGRLAGYVTAVFLNTGTILLLTTLYLAVYYRRLACADKVMLGSLYPVFILLSMLQGSRSAFLGLLVLSMCVILSRNGAVRVSRRALVAVLVMFPLAFLSFSAATHLRKAEYKPDTVISAGRIKFLETFNWRSTGAGGEPAGRLFLDRVGYLSYAADIIANSDKYSRVISPVYYAKSIIDNALTPGFFVFNTPKAANALRYVYGGLKSDPAHEDVIKEYSSDMFTVYGEYYVFFDGYPALLFLALAAYLFKKVYLSVRVKNVFAYYLYRALLLLVFHNWLNSFGMDWMLMEVIRYLIPILLLMNFYVKRPAGPPAIIL